MKLFFEWDTYKAKANLRKHGVSFEEAKTVFSDPLLLTYPDDVHSTVEERLISIGYSSRRRLLLVVHFEQDRGHELLIRMISSRRATAAEREMYEHTHT